MEKIRINFYTSNAVKFRELSLILGDDFELVQHSTELVEIQGKPLDVVKAKAIEAYSMLKEPLIVEDVSMLITALNGLPGPYIKDFVHCIGPYGICRMLKDFEDKSATVICNICFIDKDLTKVLTGEVKGLIVEPRGENAYGWNSVFEQDGTSKTFAEMTEEERTSCSHRYRAGIQLKEFLVEYYKK